MCDPRSPAWSQYLNSVHGSANAAQLLAEAAAAEAAAATALKIKDETGARTGVVGWRARGRGGRDSATPFCWRRAGWAAPVAKPSTLAGSRAPARAEF